MTPRLTPSHRALRGNQLIFSRSAVCYSGASIEHNTNPRDSVKYRQENFALFVMSFVTVMHGVRCRLQVERMA